MNAELPICLLLAAFSGALMLLIPHISPSRYCDARPASPERKPGSTVMAKK